MEAISPNGSIDFQGHLRVDWKGGTVTVRSSDGGVQTCTGLSPDILSRLIRSIIENPVDDADWTNVTWSLNPDIALDSR